VCKVERKIENGEPVQLFIEAKAMYGLRGKGIVPEIYWVGVWTSPEDEPFRILIMDRLGLNLGQLFEQ
jgi:hypothetical protein